MILQRSASGLSRQAAHLAANKVNQEIEEVRGHVLKCSNVRPDPHPDPHPELIPFPRNNFMNLGYIVQQIYNSLTLRSDG